MVFNRFHKEFECTLKEKIRELISRLGEHRYKNTLKSEINFYVKRLENIGNDTIRESLINDLKWYGNKTTNSKKLFLGFTFLTIAIPAIIPALNNYFDNNIVNIAATLNTIISAWVAFRNYKLSWTRYGSTYESIKREIRFALTGIGEYSDIADNIDKWKKLFNNVEKITEIENGNWQKYVENEMRNNE